MAAGAPQARGSTHLPTRSVKRREMMLELSTWVYIARDAGCFVVQATDTKFLLLVPRPTQLVGRHTFVALTTHHIVSGQASKQPRKQHCSSARTSNKSDTLLLYTLFHIYNLGGLNANSCQSLLNLIAASNSSFSVCSRDSRR